jgi:hypothetical protein
MLWCLAFRKDLLTLGNHTNIRIENFNRQLKRMLLPNLHLSEDLLRLVNGNYAFCSDIGYRHKREIGVRIDARCETVPSMFNAALTNAALALVTSQYMKYDDVKSEMAVTEISEGLFEIVHREKTFTDMLLLFVCILLQLLLAMCKYQYQLCKITYKCFITVLTWKARYPFEKLNQSNHA